MQNNDTNTTEQPNEVVTEATTEQTATTETTASAEPTMQAETATKVETAPVDDSTYSNLVAETTSSPELSEKKENDTYVPTESAPKVTQDNLEDVFDELKALIGTNQKISVTISEKVTGGFRAIYKNAPLFLPLSHFSLRKKPSDEEVKSALGSSFDVNVIEAKEDENRKSIVVSLKSSLVEEFSNRFKKGTRVSGKVTSVPAFGVFLDIGGAEGLIHVSRLAHNHISNPAELFKVGDEVEAVIIDVDTENLKIALSRKELTSSPWENIEEQYPIDSVHKGTVRRFTNFGAYVELSRGIDGLVRINELAWAIRLKSPNEVIELNKEYDFKVMAINKEKKAISLSYKRNFENPWNNLLAKYPQSTEVMGKITEFNEKGAIVNINSEVDAFMPKSKMRPFMVGNRINLSIGDELSCTVLDIKPDEESMILEPVVSEEMAAEFAKTRRDQPRNGDRNDRRPRQDRDEKVDLPSVSSITLGDMLNKAMLEKLGKIN